MPANVQKMRKGMADSRVSDSGRVSTGKTGYARQGGAQITLGKNPAGSGGKGGVSKLGNNKSKV